MKKLTFLNIFPPFIVGNNSKDLLKRSIFGGFLGGLAFTKLGIFCLPGALFFLWSVSSSARHSFLWGLITVLISHRWILGLHPLDWIGIPSLLSFPFVIIIWLLCGTLSGLFVYTWSSIGKIYSFLFKQEDTSGKILFALFMSSLWGLAEVFLSHMPLFWIGLGGALLPFDPLFAALAKIFGAGGLASILILFGWLIWRIILSFAIGGSWKKYLSISVSMFIFAHLFGYFLLAPQKVNSTINISTWQTSIPLKEKFTSQNKINFPNDVQNNLLKAKELKADLLIAPEGTMYSNQDLIGPSPIDFLSGGFRFENGKQKSSLLLFEENKQKFTKYIDKYRLVPIGEWMPSWLFGWPGLSAVGGLSPGDPSRLFTWNKPDFAAAICYEISDSFLISNAVAKGAEWIVAVANLDPYPISLQNQFTRLSQLRALENGREIITVANTGPTSLISSTGRVKKLIKPYEKGLIVSKINLYTRQTLYNRWRETPLILLLSAPLFYFINNIIIRLKSYN